jgi:predicted enzyme related to lactoylglutathione lyase
MPAVDRFPVGAPCWADLWTSDIEGSSAFYSALFGWEAQEPSEEFGGYFMFHRDGAPIAGGMGDMGPDMPADNSWKIYLSTDDIGGLHDALAAHGAAALSPPMAVADLGQNMVFTDPNGARLGAWQPGTFPGFAVLEEHGAPSWFELFTRDYAGALDFYRSLFSWRTEVEGDSDEFRYSTLRHPDDAGRQLAGVMDASTFLPEGVPDHWSIYWDVDDIDASVALTRQLGGAVVDGPMDTPYGRMATVTDPTGAQFKLRTPPA